MKMFDSDDYCSQGMMFVGNLNKAITNNRKSGKQRYKP